MDFIARARGIIDTAHRVTGIFILLSLALTAISVGLMYQNARLSNQVRHMLVWMPVFVVPESQAGIYAPTKDEMLITNFVEYEAESLNSYNADTLANQYKLASQFFTDGMNNQSQAYFQNKLLSVQQDGRSSMLVINRHTLRIDAVDEVDGKKGDYFKASFDALRENLIHSKVVDSSRITVTMTVLRTYVSQENPWGFLLASYKENVIPDRN